MAPTQLEQLCITNRRDKAEGRLLLDFAIRSGIPDYDVLTFLEATAQLTRLADDLDGASRPNSWLQLAQKIIPLLGYGPKESVAAASEPSRDGAPILASDLAANPSAREAETKLQGYLETAFPGNPVSRHNESVLAGFDLEAIVFTVRTGPESPTSDLAVSFLALMKGALIVDQLERAGAIDVLRDDPGHRWLFDSTGKLTRQTP